MQDSALGHTEKVVKRLKQNQGAVSLEALLSLGLLFFLLFFSWNIARGIYEVGILNNASQLATQSTLQYFDRYSPRDCSGSFTDICRNEAQKAQKKGATVFERNYCQSGARIDSIGFSGSNAPCQPLSASQIIIQCAPRPSGGLEAAGWGTCPGSVLANSQVIRTTVPSLQTSISLVPGVEIAIRTNPAYAYAWRVG